MKQTLSIISLCLLLAGCQTPPQRVAFNTLADVKAGVTGSMRSAASLHIDHKITDKQWSDVAVVYDTKFTPAFQTAVDLAKQDYSKLAPADVIALATQIVTTVEAFKH